jgi:hypothetical protein
VFGLGRSRKRRLEEFKGRLAAGEPAEQVVADFLEKDRRSNRRFGIGCALAGIVLASAALIGGIHERSLTERIPGGVSTTGRVVEVVPIGCKGGCEWQETVHFSVPGRGVVAFKPPNTTSQPAVGQVVSVSYLPSDPAGAHDVSDNDNDGDTLILVGRSTGRVRRDLHGRVGVPRWRKADQEDGTRPRFFGLSLGPVRIRGQRPSPGGRGHQ